MPNIKISDLETIAPGFDPDLVFVELQTTVNGELVSRKATASELTAGASPLNADYVTVTPNAILPNERILTGDVNIDITDGGAGAAITVSMADMAENRVKGRADATGTGIPIDLTPAQLNGILASGGFDAYFILSATGRVIGSDAGSSNTGDNVILGGALAGDLNIADGVIALGQNALAVAVQLDFAGTIAIGRNAGALLDDTRDPWVIIGDGAVGNLTGGSFHDGNTVIGTNALGNLDTTNIQGNTVIGHDVCSDMTGVSGLGVIGSSTIIGFDAGRGNVGASISNTVAIGRNACGDMGVGGVTSSVVIGNQAGESFGGATLSVILGSGAFSNAINADNCIVIGCNTASFGVSATDSQIIIGSGSIPGILTGETNVLIGNSMGITGTQLDYDHCVIIGHLAGNKFVDDQNIFAIEQPQSNTSNLARPFLFGNFLNGNLALLNIAAMTGGLETGDRINPSWADAAPTAGQGVFSMYGAGTDLAATTDADFVHFYVASADSTLTLRYPAGGDVTLLHDGSDAIIQTNIIVGDPVTDGKLFINTLTGTGPIGNIVSATPGLVSIFGAGSATLGVTAGNVEIWGGYAAGGAPASGGAVRIWGGGGGGGPAVGGDINLIGGEADGNPGDVTIIGGTATVAGNGGAVQIDGAPGFGTGARMGGAVAISAGDGVDTGRGGDTNLLAGNGSTTGRGGIVTISAGIATSAIGGLVLINGGSVQTTGVGGRIQLLTGDGGAASDAGGDIWLLVGQGNNVGASGNIYVNSTDGLAPAALSTESPGLVAMFGIGGQGVTAGEFEIHGGLSQGGATGDGGNILLESGSTTATNGDGGDIFLTVGTGNGSGVDGAIRTTGQLIVPQINDPSFPEIAFGNGDTGFYESTDGTLNIAIQGVARWEWIFNIFQAIATSGPALVSETASATNPTLLPNKDDQDTGIGWAGADQLSLIASGVEGLRFTELSTGVVQAPAASVAVTAFAGGGQGSATALIHSYNVITVVATAGDSVRLPAVFAVNSLVYIKNDDAAEAADVFPATGDDLGAGVNTAVSLPAGQSLTFMATVADSTWTLLITGGAGGAGVAGEFDNLLLSQTPGSHAASPTLRFGDGDTGMYEVVDDAVNFSNAGNDKLQFGVNSLSCSVNADSFTLLYQSSGPTTPTFVPDKADTNTGIGHGVSDDELSLVVGGVEGLRLTELSSGVIQAPSASLSVTAFATGGQGSATALVDSYNIITVVGTDGDSVRLPDTFAADSIIYIKNNDSAQAADVFPASGDNLGAGVDTAVSLLAGESLTFIATVANSTWTPLIVATGGGGAGADSDGARRSVGVPNATASYIDYTELTVDPPSTGFYTVDITFPWSGNDANITGLDLNWTIGSGATPQSQGTWITTGNTSPGGVESTTVDGGSVSGGIMPVASGTVAYVSQFHGIWDVGATLPTDIQLQFRRQGSSGTITGGTNASISIRKFADL